MDIDSLIAEAKTSAPAQPKVEASTDATTEKSSETTANANAGESAKQETEQGKAEELSESARREIAKKDQIIGKKSWQLGEQRKQTQKLQTELAEARKKLSELSPPKEEDFEGKEYKDLLRAEAKYAAQEETLLERQSHLENKISEADKAWEKDRAAAINDNYAEAKKAFGDYEDVITKAANRDGLLPMCEDFRKAILEADDGAFALYQIIKDGLFDEVNQMSPYRIAMTVARMEDKALATSKQKPVSNAPKPITALKGVGSGSVKSPQDMSAREILKWANS